MSELNSCYVNVICLHTILAAGRRLSYVAATLWGQVGPTGSEPVPASLGRALVRRLLQPSRQKFGNPLVPCPKFFFRKA